METNVYTAKEAAQYLGISERKVKEAFGGGMLKGRKFYGNILVFSERCLMAYENQRPQPISHCLESWLETSKASQILCLDMMRTIKLFGSGRIKSKVIAKRFRENARITTYQAIEDYTPTGPKQKNQAAEKHLWIEGDRYYVIGTRQTDRSRYNTTSKKRALQWSRQQHFEPPLYQKGDVVWGWVKDETYNTRINMRVEFLEDCRPLDRVSWVKLPNGEHYLLRTVDIIQTETAETVTLSERLDRAIAVLTYLKEAKQRKEKRLRGSNYTWIS